ncbi:MAG: PP2C family protein-serine/threonine phosphatase [Gemmataceae bacterium]
MTVNGLPRILICFHQPSILAELRHLLAGSGCEVVAHFLDNIDPEYPSSYHLILFESSPCVAALDLCRRLREQLDSFFVPLLFLGGDDDSMARLAALEAGANAFLARPFAAGELLAQVKALLRVKDAHDRLTSKNAEIHRLNKRLQQLHRQNEQESQLAQLIQSSLLPRSLPEVPRCRFAVHCLPRHGVGGDFHDVFRIDEHHVGLYVGDAMGHGVAASLLTIFVRTGIRSKEVCDRHDRLAAPAEVLQRLNKELIHLELSEHPFLTMAYALYNHSDATFRYARAGHPYPLYVPKMGAPMFWRQEGLLLGVVDASFTDRSYPLKAGDKVLMYNDGIDSGRFEEHQPGAESLLACATRHRHLPIQTFIDQLVRDLFAVGEQLDDVTLLGLERIAV